MPPGKRVYGKVARPQNGTAARIFAEGSSSPLAPSADVKSVPEQVSESGQSPYLTSKELTLRNYEQRNQTDDDYMARMLGRQKMNDNDSQREESTKKSTLKPSKELGRPLRERNANEIVDSPRSIRAKKRLDQKKQETAVPTHNALNEDTELRLDAETNKESTPVEHHEKSLGSEAQPVSRPLRRRKPKLPPSEVASNENSPIDDPIYEDYTAPLLNLSNKQKSPTSFQSWSDNLTPLFKVSKIAEASYGEVYRLSLKEKCLKAGVTVRKAEESVMKLIALKPPSNLTRMPNSKSWKEKVAGMSNVEDVEGEVRLLGKMTPVPGFTNFRDVLVLQGRLPPPFVQAWKDFNDHVKRSLFPDPTRKTTYPENQLWAVIEMQDAGQDLENMAVKNVHMLWDVFWGVAIAVAKGEEYASFEHRDLHLGNICVNKRPSALPKIDRSKTMGFTGIETTIIDYTLSRARMNGIISAEEDERSRQQRDIAHFDLSKDPAIFSGDESEDYQYAIYRYMRSAVLRGDPLAPSTQLKPQGKSAKQSSKSRREEVALEQAAWKEFHPLTNVIWLHFILYTLLHIFESSIPSTTPARSAKDEQHHDMLLDRLVWLRDTLLNLQGISAGVLVGDEPVKLKSTGELVTWAVSVGWLSGEDLVGHGSGNVDATSALELPDMSQLGLEEKANGHPSRGGKVKREKKKNKE